MLTHGHPHSFVFQINSFKWSLNEGNRWPGCQILTMAVHVTYWLVWQQSTSVLCSYVLIMLLYAG